MHYHIEAQFTQRWRTNPLGKRNFSKTFFKPEEFVAGYYCVYQFPRRKVEGKHFMLFLG